MVGAACLSLRFLTFSGEKESALQHWRLSDIILIRNASQESLRGAEMGDQDISLGFLFHDPLCKAKVPLDETTYQYTVGRHK